MYHVRRRRQRRRDENIVVSISGGLGDILYFTIF